MISTGDTIFLLEDDEFDVVVFRRALKTANVDACVDVVSNGQDAIDRLSLLCSGGLKQPLPFVCVLDISVPGRTGFEVCEYLKSRSALSALPVLFFSGSSSLQDKDYAFAAGAQAYFDKNEGPEQLIDCICGILERE